MEEGITHILSLERAAPCRFPDKFKCLHIDNIWDDGAKENRITPYFKTTLPFIEESLSGGGRILVHCWRGRSRSVTTIIAFLIQYHNMQPNDALSMVRKTRPDARPNSGYYKELFAFYYNLAQAKANAKRSRNYGQ